MLTMFVFVIPIIPLILLHKHVFVVVFGLVLPVQLLAQLIHHKSLLVPERRFVSVMLTLIGVMVNVFVLDIPLVTLVLLNVHLTLPLMLIKFVLVTPIINNLVLDVFVRDQF